MWLNICLSRSKHHELFISMICKQWNFVSMNRTCESRCHFETKNHEYPAKEENFSPMFLTSLYTHLGEPLSWVLITHQRPRKWDGLKTFIWVILLPGLLFYVRLYDCPWTNRQLVDKGRLSEYKRCLWWPPATCWVNAGNWTGDCHSSNIPASVLATRYDVDDPVASQPQNDVNHQRDGRFVWRTSSIQYNHDSQRSQCDQPDLWDFISGSLMHPYLGNSFISFENSDKMIDVCQIRITYWDIFLGGFSSPEQ
jgi:hypothetical protein